MGWKLFNALTGLVVVIRLSDFLSSVLPSRLKPRDPPCFINDEDSDDF